eukprot:scaffold48_cov311-Pinguiococcus_pyrenoidosus.AAC.64
MDQATRHSAFESWSRAAYRCSHGIPFRAGSTEGGRRDLPSDQRGREAAPAGGGRDAGMGLEAFHAFCRASPRWGTFASDKPHAD